MLLFYFWPFPIWEMKIKSSFYFVYHLDKPGCCIFIRRDASFLFATQCIALHAFTHSWLSLSASVCIFQISFWGSRSGHLWGQSEFIHMNLVSPIRVCVWGHFPVCVGTFGVFEIVLIEFYTILGLPSQFSAFPPKHLYLLFHLSPDISSPFTLLRFNSVSFTPIIHPPTLSTQLVGQPGGCACIWGA